jgi:hypothetical protein
MYEIKRNQLLRYLQLYLLKKLNMEIVLINIVNRLKDNKQISDKQFNSIIKFIEREPQFIPMNREGIRVYFDCLITPSIKEKNIGTNTLCEFFH